MPLASMAWNLKRNSTRSRTITLKDFDAFTNRPRFHYRTIPNTDGYAPALDDNARILRTEMIQIVVSRVSRRIGHPVIGRFVAVARMHNSRSVQVLLQRNCKALTRDITSDRD